MVKHIQKSRSWKKQPLLPILTFPNRSDPTGERLRRDWRGIAPGSCSGCLPHHLPVCPSLGPCSCPWLLRSPPPGHLFVFPENPLPPCTACLSFLRALPVCPSLSLPFCLVYYPEPAPNSSLGSWCLSSASHRLLFSAPLDPWAEGRRDTGREPPAEQGAMFQCSDPCSHTVMLKEHLSLSPYQLFTYQAPGKEGEEGGRKLSCLF